MKYCHSVGFRQHEVADEISRFAAVPMYKGENTITTPEFECSGDKIASYLDLQLVADLGALSRENFSKRLRIDFCNIGGIKINIYSIHQHLL